jgi:oligopeptide transport system ATP-binding protein
MAETILALEKVSKSFPVYGRFGRLLPPKTYIPAARNVSFSIREGETFGLVGESGSGKTTIARIIAGLTAPDCGSIRFQGIGLQSFAKKSGNPFRGDLQFVFQDPLSSFDPRQTAGAMLEESLIIRGLQNKEERRASVCSILERTGLRQEHYARYPHELSGGQRQRLALSRALITRPKLVICDEPVSALDVSIQSQILNLLTSLQKEMHLTLLFITHDIRVVRHISDKIGILYRGEMVETAETDAVFENPSHAYTRSLFSAVPKLFPGN